VESDLSLYHHIDYRDRWRRNADGTRRLTLRMIAVRIRYLPADSATALALGGSGWRLEHYLAAHLFHATAGKPHPMLPKPEKASDPEREKKIRKAKARSRERQRAIAAGEIT
jgi:hypothetical protein